MAPAHKTRRSSALLAWSSGLLLLAGAAAVLCSFSSSSAAWVLPTGSALSRSQGRRALVALRGQPDGKTLEQIQEGPDEVDGRVIRRSKAGVFIDIGGQRDALLTSRDNSLPFLLAPNETLSGLKVTVDLEKQQMAVEYPGLQKLVEGRTPSKPRDPATEKKPKEGKKAQDIQKKQSINLGGASITVSVDAKDSNKIEVKLNGLKIQKADIAAGVFTVSFDDSAKKATNAAKKETKPEEKKKVEKKKEVRAEKPLPNPEDNPYVGLTVGQEISGKVKWVNKYGIWIDIGKTKDVRLEDTTEEYGKKLKFGEDMPGLVIASYDEAKQLIRVSVKDESLVEGRELIKLEDLKEGQTLKGWVKDKNKYGTFVHGGWEVDGRLNEKTSVAGKIDLGVELEMKVESIDLEKRQIGLVLTEAEAASQAKIIADSKPTEAAADSAPAEPPAPAPAPAESAAEPPAPAPAAESGSVSDLLR